MDNLAKQETARTNQYNTQMAQMAAAEAQAKQNHENTINRIVNEVERQRQAFLAQMANLQAEADFIKQMQANSLAFLSGGQGLTIAGVTINVTEPSATAAQIAAAVTEALNQLTKTMPAGQLGN